MAATARRLRRTNSGCTHMPRALRLLRLLLPLCLFLGSATLLTHAQDHRPAGKAAKDKKHAASLTIISPTDGATMVSPVALSAAVKDSTGRLLTQVLVDGTVVFRGSGPDIQTLLTLNPGAHSITVHASVARGDMLSQSVHITVTSAPPP